jgi:hypothetical protein
LLPCKSSNINYSAVLVLFDKRIHGTSVDRVATMYSVQLPVLRTPSVHSNPGHDDWGQVEEDGLVRILRRKIPSWRRIFDQAPCFRTGKRSNHRAKGSPPLQPSTTQLKPNGRPGSNEIQPSAFLRGIWQVTNVCSHHPSRKETTADKSTHLHPP